MFLFEGLIQKVVREFTVEYNGNTLYLDIFLCTKMNSKFETNQQTTSKRTKNARKCLYIEEIFQALCIGWSENLMM